MTGVYLYILWLTPTTSYFIGATEDAINQAREAFHSHLVSKRAQQTAPDYTDEELLMEERDFDQEFAGTPLWHSAYTVLTETVEM